MTRSFTKSFALGASLLLGTLACSSGETAADGDTTPIAATPATSDRARTAASLANAIAANPSAADSILKAGGHTRESFEALMYEIAADSAMSAAYAAAKSR